MTPRSRQWPYSINYYTNGTLVNTQQTAAGWDVVARSAIVKGPDRKTPRPWSYEIYDQKGWTGRILYSYNGINYRVEGLIGTTGNYKSILPPSNATLLYNKALDRLNEKVRGGLDLSIAAAEAGTTLRMANARKRFMDGIRHLIYRRYNGLTQLGSAWLEYQYGWRPLINDIYDAHDEAVRQSLNAIQRFSAKAGQGIENYETVATISNAGDVKVPMRVSNGFEGVRISLRLDVPTSSFDIARWTSLNPASIAWETLPYSFVADWFVDIGSYLRNLETALHYNTRFVDGYVSRIRVLDASSKFIGSRNPFGINYVYDGIGNVKYREFSRTVLSSYPLPRKPSFNAELGAERLLSAASLLSQFFTSGYKPSRNEWQKVVK